MMTDETGIRDRETRDSTNILWIKEVSRDSERQVISIRYRYNKSKDIIYIILVNSLGLSTSCLSIISITCRDGR